MSSQAIPPAIPTLTVGGVVFTDLTNLICLAAWVGGSGATDNCTFRLKNTSAGYVVPASKTLKIMAVKVFPAAVGTAAAPGKLCYSDNDVGWATATAFTNQVYPYGSANGGDVPHPQALTQMPLESSADFNVPTGKYPGLTTNGDTFSGTFYIYGYLV